jgi:lysylphosphatidylglycerol synthetase-like protein (DUF2156 family)
MRYFGDQSDGFIAYRRVLGQTIVLADPVAAPASRERLVDAFLDVHPRALFMQVQTGTSDILKRRGYRMTPVGVENEIDLEEFSLKGKRKADLRHYRNKAVKGEVVVGEEQDTPDLRRELRPVSDAWLPLKSWWGHELEFLARPYQEDPEPDVRIFSGRIDGKPVGFVVLDPFYDAGVPAGYTVTILRHYPDTPEGTVDYINICAFQQLREEGVKKVSLGVSPFHHIADLAREEGHGAWPVYWTFRMLDRFGSPIYHFRGLSFHKSRYRARELPVFTGVRGPIGLLPLFASSRACRML